MRISWDTVETTEGKVSIPKENRALHPPVGDFPCPLTERGAICIFVKLSCRSPRYGGQAALDAAPPAGGAGGCLTFESGSGAVPPRARGRVRKEPADRSGERRPAVGAEAGWMRRRRVQERPGDPWRIPVLPQDGGQAVVRCSGALAPGTESAVGILCAFRHGAAVQGRPEGARGCEPPPAVGCCSRTACRVCGKPEIEVKQERA